MKTNTGTRDRQLLGLAIVCLLITGAVCAFAVWCASRPSVSFPIVPKPTAMAPAAK
jgi:hypothetical protein